MIGSSIKEYAPQIYSGFIEYETLMRAEDALVAEAEQAVANLHNDQFVILATPEGVAQYESMLKIIANPEVETLDFRRSRILNRMSFTAPFTLTTLLNKLNTLLGVGKYTAYIDYETYTIYVESSATNQSWFSELFITMGQIKPANMVFINKPLVSSDLSLSEEASYQLLKWHYRAGYWALGQQPFASIEDGGTIKMSSTTSLQPALLEAVAAFTAEDITQVRINGQVTINQFISKESSNGECIVEYSVPANTVSDITSIELLNASGAILSSFAVYVPVIEDVIIKHTIKVKEG